MKGYGIRIDSGDLAYLSKKAYQMLEAEASAMPLFPHPAISTST